MLLIELNSISKVQRADLTSDVIKKLALNARHWLVNALVTWHVSYKITTLVDVVGLSKIFFPTQKLGRAY